VAVTVAITSTSVANQEVDVGMDGVDRDHSLSPDGELPRMGGLRRWGIARRISSAKVASSWERRTPHVHIKIAACAREKTMMGSRQLVSRLTAPATNDMTTGGGDRMVACELYAGQWLW